MHKVRTTPGIQRNHDGAIAKDAEEGSHPPWAIWRPENDAVTLANALVLQPMGHAICMPAHVLKCPDFGFETALIEQGRARGVGFCDPLQKAAQCLFVGLHSGGPEHCFRSAVRNGPCRRSIRTHRRVPPSALHTLLSITSAIATTLHPSSRMFIGEST